MSLKLQYRFWGLLPCFLFLFCTPALAQTGFVENRGQFVTQDHLTNTEVLYMYTSSNIKIQLRNGGYSYEFFSVKNIPDSSSNHCKGHPAISQAVIESYRIDVNFKNANTKPQVLAENAMGPVSNYYLNGGTTLGVRSWNKITYKDLYERIDLEFIFTANPANPLKYNIILHPGADLSRVKFIVQGAQISGIRENGLLNGIKISSEFGSVTEFIPSSYYFDEPSKDQHFYFGLTGNEISFIGDYDKRRTLVIDPASSLLWGTFYGGSSLDNAAATGVDAQNNVYISGWSMSTNNIATSGAHQTTSGGSMDAYLAKFTAAGARVWSTYMGGVNAEAIYAMFVEKNGSCYITGDTWSPSGIATSGAHQQTFAGGIDDVLLAKFDSNGQRLWGTYYGGAKHDIAQAITTDAAGNVIIAGHSESTVGIATPGAYADTYNFNYDAFIAKFNPAGARLWGTYYGDSGTDEAYGLGTDTLSNIYVCGVSESISNIATAGSHQLNNGGFGDGFIAKFNIAGSSLLWGTYYGGQGNDSGTAIEVSNTGTVYVGGTTTSSLNIASGNAAQPLMASIDEAFVTAFDLNGSRIWGTYFGGNDVDYITDIIIDPLAGILFCGSTTSSNSISMSGAYQANLSSIGYYDAYFAKFSTAGIKQYSSYYGGIGNDNARGLALDNNGRLYLAGETTSTLGISTSGAFMTTPGGAMDGFLAKFCIPFKPAISPAKSATMCTGSMTFSSNTGYSNYAWSNGFTVNPMTANMPAPGNYPFFVIVSDGQNCAASSDTTYITVMTCVSVPDLLDQPSVWVYPSPASEQLTIKLHDVSQGPTTFTLCSALGQRMDSGLLINESLDIHLLPKGIYILTLKVGEDIIKARFIKD